MKYIRKYKIKTAKYLSIKFFKISEYLAKYYETHTGIGSVREFLEDKGPYAPDPTRNGGYYGILDGEIDAEPVSSVDPNHDPAF